MANDTTDLASLADSLLWQLSVPSTLGTKPGLDRVRLLLAALGNPHFGLPVMHVGGTSGKGSTATIIASILGAAGHRVGLHTKPHLRSVEERFVVDGQPISPADLVALLRRAEPAARAISPSWHELTTALMLLHFHERAVDFAVVEVGLGGTYDSTNVVTPRVAVLTNVGLDHTEVLGDTVEEIAADKVGIIKSGCRVVTGVTQPSVAAIVEARCAAAGVPLCRLGHEIRYLVTEASAAGSTFDLEVGDQRFAGLRVSLVGEHQVANASLAVAAVLALGSLEAVDGTVDSPSNRPFHRTVGIVVDEAAICGGLAAARIPGRLEVIAGVPPIVLDGAHNPDKMAALSTTLRQHFRWRHLLGVIALKTGHDHVATLREVAPLFDAVYLTRFSAETDFGPNVAQTLDALEAAWIAAGGTPDVTVEPDALAALDQARAASANGDLICVTGSLYLVGQVRAALVNAGGSGRD